MKRLIPLVTAAGAIGLLVASAPKPADALSCAGPLRETLVLRIQSVSENMIDQPDLSAYDDWTVSVASDFDDQQLVLEAISTVDARYFREELVRVTR